MVSITAHARQRMLDSTVNHNEHGEHANMTHTRPELSGKKAKRNRRCMDAMHELQ